MVARLCRIAITAASFLAVLLAARDIHSGLAQQAQAQNPYYVEAAPPIPYNYFVPSPEGSGSAAALYVSPRPTPPRVGAAFITYQPFAPHEFLYRHNRTYVRYNPDAGRTRTTVTYRSPIW